MLIEHGRVSNCASHAYAIETTYGRVSNCASHAYAANIITEIRTYRLTADPGGAISEAQCYCGWVLSCVCLYVNTLICKCHMPASHIFSTYY